MGYCKPGTTCLHHGSPIPDAGTLNNNRTASPFLLGLDGINGESSDDNHRNPFGIDYFYTPTQYDTKPTVGHDIKPTVGAYTPEPIDVETPADLIIAACKKAWPKTKGDCNHFLKAVEKELGYSDFGADDNANAIVEFCEKSPKFSRISSASEAKKLADDGAFVIAGLRGKDQHKPAEHGHVAIVTKGPLQNGAPTGYWGSLRGDPREDSSLRWAWTAEDMKNVEFFARK